MSRSLAAALFLGLCVAEVFLRIAEQWDRVRRAFRCPCPDCP